MNTLKFTLLLPSILIVGYSCHSDLSINTLPSYYFYHTCYDNEIDSIIVCDSENSSTDITKFYWQTYEIESYTFYGDKMNLGSHSKLRLDSAFLLTEVYNSSGSARILQYSNNRIEKDILLITEFEFSGTNLLDTISKKTRYFHFNENGDLSIVRSHPNAGDSILSEYFYSDLTLQLDSINYLEFNYSIGIDYFQNQKRSFETHYKGNEAIKKIFYNQQTGLIDSVLDSRKQRVFQYNYYK